MSSYQINPPVHVGECATCGHVQEREICEDCEAKEEARKAPYLAFWAALAVDAELQRSFDHETQAFDSGHRIELFMRDVYKIFLPNGNDLIAFINCEWTNVLTLPDAVEWCIENREVLI